MDKTQFAWLHEELVSAADQHELVIVVSHHRLARLSTIKVKSLAEMVKKLIGELGQRDSPSSPGTAIETAKSLQTANGEGGFWELMTTSTIDFPMQSRILEIVDEHNGYLSIYVTNVGHNSAATTLASKARQLAAGKLAFRHDIF